MQPDEQRRKGEGNGAGHGGRSGRPADVVVYLAVAYATTWLILSPLALAGAGVITGAPSWLHLLGGVGPLVGVVVASGGAGLGAAWRGGLVRVPRAPWVWLWAAGIPLALLGLALVVALGVGGGESGGTGAALPGVVLVSLAYAIPEEAGWRGYLLPRLQARWTALWSSLAVGVAHAAWHLPMFFYRYDASPGSVVGFALAVLAGSVVFTHLYNLSGGSVGVGVVFHAVWNLGTMGGAAWSGMVPAVMSVGLMVVATLLWWRYGGVALAPGGPVGFHKANQRL